VPPRLKHLPRWLTLGALVVAGVLVVVTLWILPLGGTTSSPPLGRPQLGPPRVSRSQEMLSAVPLDRSAIVIAEDTYTALLAHGGKVSPLRPCEAESLD